MITIIGAGKVGGDAALFTALRRLDDEILLLDIAEGLPQGEAMDLNHMLSEQGIDVNVKGSNNYEDMRGSKIVVVVAGAGRKPGMTRMDLLKINAGVVKDKTKLKNTIEFSVSVIILDGISLLAILQKIQSMF